jgi:peptidoglycan/xylan/chitin deacetylase (PgdA/CDA1 family)
MSQAKIPFVWTNDDLSVSNYSDMETLLQFLDRFGLKGTFFVVPCPEGTSLMTDDAKFVDALKAMKRAGHDPQQHSTTHMCIENGTADLRMFDLMGDDAKQEYSQLRFVHERLWQVDALQAQIGWGRQVWTDAMGAPSDGFRPGCGAFCGNMYQALENLGFKWCSARMVSMTGWMWADGNTDYPRRLEGPVAPVRQGNIVEFPIVDDVAFRIPSEKIDDFAELGWQHWQECVERNVPFVLVSHPFALKHDGGSGYAVHEKLLPRILDSGLADPMTLSEYYARIESGEYSCAAPEDAYPGGDEFPDWHILSRVRQAAKTN